MTRDIYGFAEQVTMSAMIDFKAAFNTTSSESYNMQNSANMEQSYSFCIIFWIAGFSK